MGFETSSDIRDELIKRLKSDVLGPIGLDSENKPDENESLKLEDGAPQNFYITGYLEPQKWIDQEEVIDSFSIEEGKKIDDLSSSEIRSHVDSTEVEDKDSSVLSGNTISAPSSMGISTVISNLENSLNLHCSWGEYAYDSSNKTWNRQKCENSLILDSNNLKKLLKDKKIYYEIENTGIFYHIRLGELSGEYHLTCRLVNKRQLSKDSNKIDRGEATIFQTKLIIEYKSFKDARNDSKIITDPTTAILYHDSRVYARGHNVGVDWSSNGDRVWTEWIPEFEVRRMEQSKELQDLIPEMELLIDPKKYGEGIDRLKMVIDEYENWNHKVTQWYNSQGKDTLSNEMFDYFPKHVENITENISRMRDGLNLISEATDAKFAFRYANEAILESAECPAGGIERGKFKWRPFQICFILLNLSGLLWDENESKVADRDIIDLAWFPTGGGKTEAYFGLIATLGFYREIKQYDNRGDERSSVHCIMRYTLRLLTLNQGERATRLITGMNIVARKYEIREDPFKVGMWIGSGASPNTLSEAQSILNEMVKTGGPPQKGSTPLQLDRCPWCNVDISNPNQWKIENKKLLGFCSSEKCEYHSRPVPFACIDEELYENPPSLLIATVDKFARLASVPEARHLIGLRDSIPKRPPDLVIQDELHLLTGPLGSLAGLFESSIETLWNNAGHKAKYVAATATIRGAERDSALMFNRTLNVFPPPGYSIKDNFFSTEKPEKDGRKHLAIIGNLGHSTTLLERPFASVLQRCSDIMLEITDTSKRIIVDPYWTPIGYFNSLRELSGALSSIEDAIIQQHIPEFASRSGTNERQVSNYEELFSRKRAHELKTTLSRLTKNMNKTDSLDTCLTTNMFQVGIDVDRLGLMLINGQPKSNSEYIQASGRVGRDSKMPGLVVSLLRSAKPRDLSHYEMHRAFHQEMYRHVDITTTTPFSARAFDRAMATILMILLRQGIPAIANNDGIRKLTYPDVKNKAEKLINKFLGNIIPRVETEQRIVIERRVRRQWDGLKQWADKYKEEGFWRHKTKESWANGFDVRDSQNEDILDSMRDVTDDIPFGKVINGENKVIGRLPESHLFSHAMPGGLWDKDGQALMTNGLNKWLMTEQQRQELEISEHVLSTLLENTKVFRPPKMATQGIVSVDDFPREVRCSAEPAHISTGKRTKDGIFCSHEGCGEKAVPVRFVSLCSNGHLEPFNWNTWINHKNCDQWRDNSYKNVRIKKLPGAGYTLSSWIVKCNSCGAERSLKGVTQNSSKKCREISPWIEWEPGQNCLEKLSNRRRNSSSISHPVGGSVILIHPNVNWHLAKKVESLINMDEDRLDTRFDMYFEDYCEAGIFDGTIYDRSLSISTSSEPRYDVELFRKDLMDYRNRPMTARRNNIRQLERTGLAHGNRKPVDDGLHYYCSTEYGGEVTADGWWNDPVCPINHLSRVNKLTEVRYINGIQRLNMNDTQPIGVFKNEHHNWNLGKYNHGEGIYLGINPEWIQRQITGDQYYEFDPKSIETHSISKEIDFNNKHIRKYFPILHTFSHLLIKELCHESGYSLGSISERLYMTANSEGLTNLGILLFTTGSSSDGTLGGLSSQANRDKIELIVKQALIKKDECSNDPICSEHRPTPEEINGAACHSCVLLPETCCELSNKILDRNWGQALENSIY